MPGGASRHRECAVFGSKLFLDLRYRDCQRRDSRVRRQTRGGHHHPVEPARSGKHQRRAGQAHHSPLWANFRQGRRGVDGHHSLRAAARCGHRRYQGLESHRVRGRLVQGAGRRRREYQDRAGRDDLMLTRRSDARRSSMPLLSEAPGRQVMLR